MTLPWALLPPLPPDSVLRAYALAAGEVKSETMLSPSTLTGVSAVRERRVC